jgi:hypothetical protein
MSSRIAAVSRTRPYDQLAMTQAADDAGQRIHPQPAKGARKQQTDDDQHGHRGVGGHVDHGGAHIVVARRRPVDVLVLFERDGMVAAVNPHDR